MLFADLHFGVLVGACIAERDLGIGIRHLSVGDNFEVLEYLYVALVGVHDYIEVFIGAKHLGQHIAK